MTQNSPFKFLDAYQKEDADIFFGREDETQALYDALSGVKHLLVYGPSGAGKTSLIECGLRNQFSDADWFALTIRKGANINASVFARINEALDNKINLDPQKGLPTVSDYDFGNAIEALFDERYQPVYLLFDQFEELLILGEEEEQKEFFTRLNQLIRYKIPCRVILIMREEFVGYLHEFEPICPSIFQHRFRLEKMNRSKVAEEVLQKTLTAEVFEKDFEVKGKDVDELTQAINKDVDELTQAINKDVDELTQAIISKLPDKRKEIELTHVQVFLDELWHRAAEKANAGDKPQLNASLIVEEDNLEIILESFLKKQLENLDQRFQYKKNEALELLAVMISERNTKLQLSENEIQKELGQKNVSISQLTDLLKALEENKILRSLKIEEQTQYELSHDILALVVGQNLTEEIKRREKALAVYRLYEDRSSDNLLAPNELKQLSAYEKDAPYPPTLEQLIRVSEEKIREEEDKAIKAAQAQAEKERQLREQAEASAKLAEQNAEEARVNAELAKKKAKEAESNANLARSSERKAKRSSTFAIGIAVIAVIAAVMAWYYSVEANEKKDKAKEQTKKANENLIIAYQADIVRYAKEIEIIENNMKSLERLEIDTKDLQKFEKQKKDSLSRLKDGIKQKMDSLQIELQKSEK